LLRAAHAAEALLLEELLDLYVGLPRLEAVLHHLVDTRYFTDRCDPFAVDEQAVLLPVTAVPLGYYHRFLRSYGAEVVRVLEALVDQHGGLVGRERLVGGGLGLLDEVYLGEGWSVCFPGEALDRSDSIKDWLNTRLVLLVVILDMRQRGPWVLQEVLHCFELHHLRVQLAVRTFSDLESAGVLQHLTLVDLVDAGEEVGGLSLDGLHVIYERLVHQAVGGVCILL